MHTNDFSLTISIRSVIRSILRGHMKCCFTDKIILALVSISFALNEYSRCRWVSPLVTVHFRNCIIHLVDRK